MMRFRQRFVAGAAFLWALAFFLAGAALPARAQYFGQNKVQYDKFDFQVMKTAHFDIYFYGQDRKVVDMAARMAERWYARLSRILRHELRKRQPLILYSSHPDFEQTTTIQETLTEGTGGFTEVFKRRIVLPYGGTLAETDHVIGHELVHAFQYDMTAQAGSGLTAGLPNALRLPLWFIEGMAEYLSIGPVDAHTAMWMRDAVLRKKLPTIKQLQNPYRYFPYRYGQALWAYICGRWGDLVISRIMKDAGRAGDYEKSMERILGVSLKQLSADWHAALERDFAAVLSATRPASDYGPQVVRGSEEVGLNVSPSLSPDGDRFVFLSSKDLFSVEMFVTDTRTGKTTEKITKTAFNPEFQSLQFIYSTGSWSPTGEAFVFGAVGKGQPLLALLDTKTYKVTRRIVIPELGEILNPTWSPDGTSIAFSALAGGVTDLFVYDLDTDSLRRLTDDVYGDIHPAWSPDGRSIAFVTERFNAHLPTLSIGAYQLALIDPAGGEVEQVETFPYANCLNPQWSPDSKTLFFISDRSGIKNVYRRDLESGRLAQVTNLKTGVSGISGVSPSLTVAAGTGLMAFSVYDGGNYSIYTLSAPDLARGSEPASVPAKTSPAALPPLERQGSEVLGLIKNPLFGLPEDAAFPVSPYSSKLALDYVSQPQMAVGADRFGTYIGGGLSFYWSDMLGYHNMATMFQVNNRLIDSAVLVGYVNSRSRWNWGAVAQRIPYVYGSYGYGYGEMGGEPVYFEQEYLFRQINYDLGAFVSYPFSRVQRAELTGGLSYIDYDAEINTLAYSLYDNYLIYREREKLEAPDSMSYGYIAAALVYDSSIFGASGPLIGQSYRLEVSPRVGSLSFTQVLADYRRYVMPVRPFTLAFRLVHFGRYGKNAEDERLWPLFIGYESLLRGYDYYSFKADSSPGAFDMDRLFGSRLAVANLELRFPVFGLLGLGKGFYGIFPLEAYAFYDLGVAWDKTDKASFLGGDRMPLSSVGIGLRANLFGYLIAGVHYVKPFQRTDRDWYFQFSLSPAF
jgi:Tol biopolymer transport system component